jgi:hypothetical protein
LRRFSIEFGELNQLYHVYAALTRFTLVEESMRQPKLLGDLTLCQASLFPESSMSIMTRSWGTPRWQAGWSQSL